MHSNCMFARYGIELVGRRARINEGSYFCGVRGIWKISKFFVNFLFCTVQKYCSYVENLWLAGEASVLLQLLQVYFQDTAV